MADKTVPELHVTDEAAKQHCDGACNKEDVRERQNGDCFHLSPHGSCARPNGLRLPDKFVKDSVPETPKKKGWKKAGTGISSSGCRRVGVGAGYVVSVISGVIILGALISVLMYPYVDHYKSLLLM